MIQHSRLRGLSITSCGGCSACGRSTTAD